jgi:ribosomal protein L31
MMMPGTQLKQTICEVTTPCSILHDEYTSVNALDELAHTTFQIGTSTTFPALGMVAKRPVHIRIWFHCHPILYTD